MNIYTKTGDEGTTGLFGGPRVRKNDPRIEAYGTVDELNAALGMVRAAGLPAEFDRVVARVQNELFDLGAELATPNPGKMGTATIGALQIAALEQEIDDWDAKLPPLKQFILPGGTATAAGAHFARTVCRRAERRVLTLGEQPGGSIRYEVVIYLNRLSDWLFVLARAINAAAGRGDEPWRKAND